MLVCFAQRERQKLKRRKRRGRPRHAKGGQKRPSPDISRATLPFLPRIRHEICVPVPLSMSKMPPYGKKREGRKPKRLLAYTEDELSRGPAVYRTAKRLGPGGPFAAIAFFLAGTLERRGGLLISVYTQSLSFRSKNPANPWKRMLLPCKSVTDLLRCLGRTALADRWKKAMTGDILAEQCARSYAVSALLCHYIDLDEEKDSITISGEPGCFNVRFRAPQIASPNVAVDWFKYRSRLEMRQGRKRATSKVQLAIIETVKKRSSEARSEEEQHEEEFTEAQMAAQTASDFLNTELPSWKASSKLLPFLKENEKEKVKEEKEKERERVMTGVISLTIHQGFVVGISLCADAQSNIIIAGVDRSSKASGVFQRGDRLVRVGAYSLHDSIFKLSEVAQLIRSSQRPLQLQCVRDAAAVS